KHPQTPESPWTVTWILRGLKGKRRAQETMAPITLLVQFFHPLALQRSEPEFLVQADIVGRPQNPALQTLELGMRLNALHHPLAQAPPSIRFQDVVIGEIRERGVIADDASKADLLCTIVNPEAKRASGCAGHSFLCNPSGVEVSAREERLHGLHIQFAGIGADQELPLAVLLNSGLENCTGSCGH